MDTATLEKPDTAKAGGVTSIQAKSSQAMSRPTSLHMLADRSLKEADGDVHRATEALIETLLGDKYLMRELMGKIVAAAVRLKVSAAHRSTRSAICKGADKRAKAAVEDFANGMAASLLDFPLMNGIKLREATKADLMATIKHYTIQAGECQRRADFLNAVLKVTPVNGVAGDVLDDEKVQKLWQESANEF